MKTEINNENRQKFYSLYYLQDVFIQPLMGQDSTYYFNGANVDETEDNDGCYLLLNQLSEITDDHLAMILPIVQQTSYYRFETNFRMARQVFKQYLNKSSSIHGSHWWQIQDVLRSLGYALPWMGLSVEDLVNAGWVKLKGGSSE